MTTKIVTIDPDSVLKHLIGREDFKAKLERAVNEWAQRSYDERWSGWSQAAPPPEDYGEVIADYLIRLMQSY